MPHLNESLTWVIFGNELHADELPELDGGQRDKIVAGGLRPLATTMESAYGLLLSQELINTVLDRGDVRWMYVQQDDQCHRFAAISFPACTNEQGQEIAAVATVGTRRPKTGRTTAAHALGRALAETIGVDHTKHTVLDHTELSIISMQKTWQLLLVVGRGAVRTTSTPLPAMIADVLNDPEARAQVVYTC